MEIETSPTQLECHVVIGGLPRSGTSFIRAIIGSHSQVALYKWELPFWTQIYGRYGNRVLTPRKSNNLLDELFSSYTLIKSDVFFKREDIANKLRESARPISCDVYRILMDEYRKAKNKTWVGIKTPFNEYWAGSIFYHFPNTKFIHVIRNPVDVSKSLKQAKKNWWGGDMNYFKHIYDWKKSANLAKINSHKFPDNYLVLQYEHMTTDPESTAQKICAFLKIEFEPTMLRMEGQPGWKGSNSSFEKKDFSKKVSATTDNYYYALIGDMMTEMGYRMGETLLTFKVLLNIRFWTWSLFYHHFQWLVLQLKRAGFRRYKSIRPQ